MSILSKKIKEIRLKLKLTQKEFAYILGIPRSNIANYETGRVVPPGDITWKIMKLEKGKGTRTGKSKKEMEVLIGKVFDGPGLYTSDSNTYLITKNLSDESFDILSYNKPVTNLHDTEWKQIEKKWEES